MKVHVKRDVALEIHVGASHMPDSYLVGVYGNEKPYVYNECHVKQDKLAWAIEEAKQYVNQYHERSARVAAAVEEANK